MSKKFRIEKSKSYRNVVYCKLTDSLNNSIENYINASTCSRPLQVTIRDGKGTIDIPQNKSFSFTVENLKNQGLTACFFRENKLSLAGKVTCKFNVEASVDSIAKTMKRIEQVQDEVKQNCVKELKRTSVRQIQAPPKRQALEPVKKAETSQIIFEDLPKPNADVQKMLRESIVESLCSGSLTRKLIEDHVSYTTKLSVKRHKSIIDKILSEIAIEINSNKGVVYKLRAKEMKEKLNKAENPKQEKPKAEPPKAEDGSFEKYRKMQSLKSETDYVSCGSFYNSNYEIYTTKYQLLKNIKDKYTNWTDMIMRVNSESEAQKIATEMTTSFELEINEDFYNKVEEMGKFHDNMAHIKKLLTDYEERNCIVKN